MLCDRFYYLMIQFNLFNPEPRIHHFFHVHINSCHLAECDGTYKFFFGRRIFSNILLFIVKGSEMLNENTLRSRLLVPERKIKHLLI